MRGVAGRSRAKRGAAWAVCVTVDVAASLVTWECSILTSPECRIGAQRPEKRTWRCYHPTVARLGLEDQRRTGTKISYRIDRKWILMYLIYVMRARGSRSGEVIVYPIPLQCFYRCLQVVISILAISVSFWLKR